MLLRAYLLYKKVITFLGCRLVTLHQAVGYPLTCKASCSASKPLPAEGPLVWAGSVRTGNWHKAANVL